MDEFFLFDLSIGLGALRFEDVFDPLMRDFREDGVGMMVVVNSDQKGGS